MKRWARSFIALSSALAALASCAFARAQDIRVVDVPLVAGETMRERAAVIGGQLDVRSVVGRGTEVELRVPGRNAYEAAARTGHWWDAFRRQRAPAENGKRPGSDA